MDAKTARECFLYEKNTGRLVWKSRPVHHFKTPAACRAVNRRCAGKEAGLIKSNGYRYVRAFGKDYQAHRVAWLLVRGEWPEQIDHRNRIRCDNRWPNLRDVTGLENHQNMSPYANNKSGTPGVHWCKTHRKWVAKITRLKRRRTLGHFIDIADAVRARLSAEREN